MPALRFCLPPLYTTYTRSGPSLPVLPVLDSHTHGDPIATFLRLFLEECYTASVAWGDGEEWVIGLWRFLPCPIVGDIYLPHTYRATFLYSF